MATKEPWLTSVDDLMRIFRDALVAILPSLERAKIHWHKSDAYDQWDHIAETLFQEIVVDTIRWGVNDFEAKVPRYDFTYSDYSAFSFASVSRRGTVEAGNLLAFLNFDPNDDTFSVVRCLEVDQNGIVGRPCRVPLDEAFFVFEHRQPDGSLVPARDLSITL